VDPAAALARIAYLLETAQAPTYKVRAFRTAAGVAGQHGADGLRRLGPSGVKSLKGIGDTSATVIAEALAGEVPAYLRQLEAERVPPPDGAGAALRARLRGDCHSHSNWSDGGSPIKEMAQAARDLGHQYLVLTDHSPRLTVAHGLNAERLVEQLAVVDELNEELAPFRILRGIEVDILEDGSLDQDDELLGQLDVVVASVHSKLRMERPAMTDRMLAAIESPHTDILGHCTGRLLVGRGRPQSTFDADQVFDACARTGTAVEINARPERQDPPDDLLALALQLGCQVSIDSDAHAPGQLEWVAGGCDRAVLVGVTADRVVNTMDADDLVAWAAGHGG
jgi:putative hydrolase